MGEIMLKSNFSDELSLAIDAGHIKVYYQPQYNHITGRIVGAEALMRWEHSAYGMLRPSDFIPDLEKSGLMVAADLFVFDQICQFQASRIEDKKHTAPISFNVSKVDIANPDYIDNLEKIRNAYNIPTTLLRAEITEMAAEHGPTAVASVMKRFHDLGYIVEIDDFGDGYSSLNILKDLDFDILKLDMKFLESDIEGRGGIILRAMVEMAKWLGIPVIAEGVETIEQADYLMSIGCRYIQGYLYSRPVPDGTFATMLESDNLEATKPSMEFIGTMQAAHFWDPASIETLIFSNYVGAAMVFSYENGNIDLLRVNRKYIDELGMNLSERDIVKANPWDAVDEENKKAYIEAVEKAIETEQEQVVETWRTIQSGCCPAETLCIRSTLQVIGRTDNEYIIYALIRNITNEKIQWDRLQGAIKQCVVVADQANIYAWEYDVTTHQMKPCPRCMRDLHLPALIENYPEPVIDDGIFPPEFADTYRDWHRQLAEGVESLEAIVPLTKDRVPFVVRYTAEFDELGRPWKAYGSATLVQGN